MRRIERLVGAPFRWLGMAKVASDEPLAVEVQATFQFAGRAWVAEDDGGLVGYILAEIVDRSAQRLDGTRVAPTCGMDLHRRRRWV